MNELRWIATLALGIVFCALLFAATMLLAPFGAVPEEEEDDNIWFS